MSVRLRHLIVMLALAALAVPSSSMAGSASVNAPSWGDPTVEVGAGFATSSKKIWINSVTNINDTRRLRFSATEDNQWFMDHRQTERYCPNDGCVGPHRWLYPGGTKGVDYDQGDAMVQRLGDKVRLRNKCEVSRAPFNTQREASDADRADCEFTDAYSKIHPNDPTAAADTPMGAPTHVTVRVWRDCRVDPATREGAAQRYLDGGALTSGSPGVDAETVDDRRSCEVSPIFERTIAERSSEQTRTNFFFVRATGPSKVENTTSKAYDAFRARNAFSPIAGPGYGSCHQSAGVKDIISKADQIKGKKLCSETSQYLGAGKNNYGAGQYNQRCRDGGVAGDQVNWSYEELVAEIEFRAKRAKEPLFVKHYDAMLKWAADRRDGRASSVLPPGFSDGSPSSRNLLCETLSESIAVDWNLKDEDRASATVKMNYIPGRVYLVQIVYTDARENIIDQHYQVFSSNAKVDEGVCETGCAAPRERAPQVPANLDFTTDLGALNGSPVQMDLASSPAGAGSSESGDDAVRVRQDASLWMPRAAAFTIHSNQESANGYAKNVKARTLDMPADTGLFAQKSGRHLLQGGRADTLQAGIFEHLGAAGATNVLSSRVPLLGTLTTGRVTARATSVMQRPTRASTKKPAVDLPAHENVARGLKLDVNSNRFATLLGENRYLAGSTRHNASAPTASQTEPRYGWQRITANTCSDPDGLGERLPRMELPRENGSFDLVGCNANAALGSGWTVSDAYTVQPFSAKPTGADAPTDPSSFVELAALVSQEKTGPARIQLAPQHLRANVTKVEVWKVQDYLERTREDLEDEDGNATIGRDLKYPIYYNTGQDKAPNTPAGLREINFCEREVQERYWVDVPYNSWEKVGTQEYLRDPAGGPLDIYHYLNAPGRVWPMRDGYPLGPVGIVDGFDVDNDWSRALLDRNHYGGGRAGAEQGDVVYGSEWGRSWWGTGEDLRTQQRGWAGWVKKVDTRDVYGWVPRTRPEERTRMVENPDCPKEGASRDTVDGLEGQPVTELPAGDYVVVYRVLGPVNTPTQWGVRAKSFYNPSADWRVRLNFAQSHRGVRVYRTRATG